MVVDEEPKPKTPARPKMEASSTTATRRASTIQTSNSSVRAPASSTSMKPTQSTVRRAATSAKTPPSPVPSATNSIRRATRTPEGALTSSASRRTATPPTRAAAATPSASTATTPTPTTLSRRSTTSTLGKGETPKPKPTVSRRVTLTTNPSTSVQRPLARSAAANGNPGTPMPTRSRQVRASSTSTSSRGSVTNSIGKTETTVNEERIEEQEEDELTSQLQLEKQIQQLTEEINTTEQQLKDNSEVLANKQQEIDGLHKVLEESQSQQEERLLEAILEMTDQLKEKEAERNDLLVKLDELSTQANERLILTRQAEEVEQAGRDEMESLRDELQLVNDQLESTLKLREKEWTALQQTSGALREEIQNMHKTHQSRMTSLSNQLQQQHTEEIAALSLALESEYNDKQNNSEELLNVDAKRKVKVELEAKIQDLEKKLLDLNLQFKQQQQDLNLEAQQRSEAIVNMKKTEMEQVALEMKNQLAQLEDEHSHQISSLESQQQSEIIRATTLIDDRDKGNMDQLQQEIKSTLREDYDQKVLTILQEQKSLQDRIQTQLNDAISELENMKSTNSQNQDKTRERMEQECIDQKASTVAQLEKEYAAKLTNMIKESETTLETHRFAIQEEHRNQIKSLETAFDKELKTLVNDHDKKQQELQSSTAAAVRAATERQVRSEFDVKMENLAVDHRQAMEDLQSQHNLAIKSLEDATEKVKQDIQVSHLSLSQKKEQSEAELRSKESNDHIESIRTVVQASLKETHASNISKVVAEHESKLNEMKRHHILQRDRAMEKMTKDFESELVLIKQKYAGEINSQQNAHDDRIKQMSMATEDTVSDSRLRLIGQHQTRKMELQDGFDLRINELTADIEKRNKEREDLCLQQQQLVEEINLFKETSWGQLEFERKQLEGNKAKMYRDLEADFQSKMEQAKLAHRVAMDTQHSEYQQALQQIDIPEERWSYGLPVDIKDSLKAGYKTQLQEFTVEQQHKLDELQAALDNLKKENAAIVMEHQAQIQSLEKEWKDRLEDATASADQSSEAKMLDEPIRIRMHAETKESQEKLAAAHTTELNSLAASHTQTLDHLSKQHEVAIAELSLKLDALLEEHASLTHQIKVMEEEHTEKVKSVTDAHQDSVTAFKDQWQFKEKDYISTLENCCTQLKEIQQQLKLLTVEYQSISSKHDSMRKQLNDQPKPDSTAKSSSIAANKSYHNGSVSSLEKDILDRKKRLQQKDQELEQLSEEKSKRMKERELAQQAESKEQEDLIHGLVIQHQEEIETMHRHLQYLLDVKDDEMNNVSYRLKTVTLARQKDIDKMQAKQRSKIHSLEELSRRLKDNLNTKTEAYNKNRALEDEVSQNSTILQQAMQGNQDLKGQLSHYKAERHRLLQQIHRLQSEMHQVQLG